MTFTDSPDWQEVAVTVSAAGAMPDAPDWQRTTVAPGGAPSGGGGGEYMGLPPSALTWQAWTSDPQGPMTQYDSFAGQIRMTALYIPSDMTVSKLIYMIKPAASGNPYLAPCQCGIYSATNVGVGLLPNFTLVAETDPTATLNAFNTIPTSPNVPTPVSLTSSVALSAKTLYYVGTYMNSNGQACFYSASPTIPSDIAMVYGFYVLWSGSTLPSTATANGPNGETVWSAVA